MALHPEILDIDDPESIEPLLAAMTTFTGRGRGWINIQPDIAPDAGPSHRSALTEYFRRNSPDAALVTWMAPPTEPADAPATVGLQHAVGTRVGPLLEEWGVPLGEGWRRVQDSPRRGLLVTVPATEDHELVVRWLLDLTIAASTRPTRGTWRASIYRGRGA